MPMLDLAALTAPCAGAFGDSVAYQPLDDDPLTVLGIFDEAYRDLALGGDGIAATVTVPVLGVRVADFASMPRQGDLLTITRTAETFRVKEVRVDGHGWAQLMLNFERNE